VTFLEWKKNEWRNDSPQLAEANSVKAYSNLHYLASVSCTSVMRPQHNK